MSTIDEIKQRLDIIDILSGYVKLEKAGRNFKALCPFHEEKTPSFIVFPEKQSWRCFGCGAGGDLLSFVMKKEGVDFGEALKMLAERAGVTLVRRKETAEDKLGDRLYQANEAAAQYYHDLLLREPAAKQARDYADKRGLDRKAIDDFQLGFSQAEGLKKHLLEKGFRDSELLAAGLCGERDKRTYDYFRHRLMYPIRDIKGKVVGFGARALDESLPKYLNSPQTPIFDKSSILYGIDRAKGVIRDKGLAVIVEGYMDVIAAHQHGEANVVASMGTALTEKQIRVLKRLTRRLVFALDPDAAGEAATMRGIEVVRRSLYREGLAMPTVLGTTSKLGVEISIIPLPPGKDPDAVIRENSQEWQRLVDQALPLLDHLIRVTASNFDLSRPEGKSQASEQLLPLIAELQDDVEREFYLGKLANLVGVSERKLIEMSARLHRTRSEKGSKATAKPVASISPTGDPLEEYCLTLLLQHPELRGEAEGLMPEHFERSENREIFTSWRDTFNIDELRQMVGIELEDYLESLLGRVMPPADELLWGKDLARCIGKLEERRLRLHDEYITSEIVSGIKDGEELDSERLVSLQQGAVEVNAELVKRMQERTGTSFFNREEQ